MGSKNTVEISNDKRDWYKVEPGKNLIIHDLDPLVFPIEMMLSLFSHLPYVQKVFNPYLIVFIFIPF